MIRSSPSFRETSNRIQEKIMLFESNNLRNFTEVEDKYTSVNIEPRRMIPPMIHQHHQQHQHQHHQQQQQQPSPSSQMPAGVVLDANGLIVPKKLVNPCLESRDRKNLHRELLFSQKIGQPVIKQKSELQKALQKQKDRQFRASMQQEQQERSFQSEFDHMIIERSKRITNSGWSDQQQQQQHQQQQQQQQFYHQQQRMSLQQHQHQQQQNNQFQQHQQQQSYNHQFQQQQLLNQYQSPQHNLHQQMKQQQQLQQQQQRPHLLQRQELQNQLSSNIQDDFDQLNPEYIKARAKLRVTMDK